MLGIGRRLCLPGRQPRLADPKRRQTPRHQAIPRRSQINIQYPQSHRWQRRQSRLRTGKSRQGRMSLPVGLLLLQLRRRNEFGRLFNGRRRRMRPWRIFETLQGTARQGIQDQSLQEITAQAHHREKKEATRPTEQITSCLPKKGLHTNAKSEKKASVTNELGKKAAAKIRVRVLTTLFDPAGYIAVAYNGNKPTFAHAIENTAGYKPGEPVLICIPRGYVGNKKKQ